MNHNYNYEYTNFNENQFINSENDKRRNSFKVIY